MENFNVDLFLKITAVLISFYQLRNLRLITRSALKTDLEILKMLDKDDPNIPSIKDRIAENIDKIYGRRYKVYYPIEFGLMLFAFLGYSYFAYVSFNNDHIFWGLLAIFICIIFLFAIPDSLRSPKERLERIKRRYRF